MFDPPQFVKYLPMTLPLEALVHPLIKNVPLLMCIFPSTDYPRRKLVTLIYFDIQQVFKVSESI